MGSRDAVDFGRPSLAGSFRCAASLLNAKRPAIMVAVSFRIGFEVDTMLLEDAKVLQQREIQGGYCLLVMSAPAIAPKVQPGQFVHLRVPQLDSAVLRRPFSVYRQITTPCPFYIKMSAAAPPP